MCLFKGREFLLVHRLLDSFDVCISSVCSNCSFMYVSTLLSWTSTPTSFPTLSFVTKNLSHSYLDEDLSTFFNLSFFEHSSQLTILSSSSYVPHMSPCISILFSTRSNSLICTDVCTYPVSIFNKIIIILLLS